MLQFSAEFAVMSKSEAHICAGSIISLCLTFCTYNTPIIMA